MQYRLRVRTHVSLCNRHRKRRKLGAFERNRVRGIYVLRTSSRSAGINHFESDGKASNSFDHVGRTHALIHIEKKRIDYPQREFYPHNRHRHRPPHRSETQPQLREIHLLSFR